MMNKERDSESNEDSNEGPVKRHWDRAEKDEEEDTEDEETQSSVNPEISEGKIPKVSKTPNKINKEGKEKGKKARYSKVYLCSYVATQGIILALKMLILHVGLENWSHEWSCWDDVQAGFCSLNPESVLDGQGTYQQPEWLATLIKEDPYMYCTNSYIFICYCQLNTKLLSLSQKKLYTKVYWVFSYWILLDLAIPECN